MIRSLVTFWLLTALFTGLAEARGTYQDPAEFVREAFSGQPPAPSVLWVTEALQSEVESVLGHPLSQKRVRYWRDGTHSVWVLDEIGKEEPITVGVVVRGGLVDQIKILVYRESRGDEVRLPTFTRQFSGAGLTPDRKLDRTIDGISGATLSVHALKGVAATALVLDQYARTP